MNNIDIFAFLEKHPVMKNTISAVSSFALAFYFGFAPVFIAVAEDTNLNDDSSVSLTASPENEDVSLDNGNGDENTDTDLGNTGSEEKDESENRENEDTDLASQDDSSDEDNGDSDNAHTSLDDGNDDNNLDSNETSDRNSEEPVSVSEIENGLNANFSSGGNSAPSCPLDVISNDTAISLTQLHCISDNTNDPQNLNTPVPTYQTEIMIIPPANALDSDTVVGEPYEVRWEMEILNSTHLDILNPTGIVTISDGTGGECTSDLSTLIGLELKGECTITSTSAGQKDLVASYGGDNKFAGSVSNPELHTVNKADTTTTITNTSDLGNSSVVGSPYIVSWNVLVSLPGAGNPTGTVTVTEDGNFGCEAQVADGGCSITPSTSGTKSLTATYNGDNDFNSSNSSAVNHPVDPANNGGGNGGGGNGSGGGSSGGGSSSGGFVGGGNTGGQVLGASVSEDELLELMKQLLYLLQLRLAQIQSESQPQPVFAQNETEGEVLGEEIAQAQEMTQEEEVIEEMVEEETSTEDQDDEEAVEDSGSRVWLWVILGLILVALLFLALRKKKA